MLSTVNITNISLLILITIFIILCFFKPGALENWEVYKQKPLQYVKTGGKPVNFYRLDRYRKPYMYPNQFRKSYPVDHMSYRD